MNLEASLKKYGDVKKKPPHLIVGKTIAQVIEQAAIMRQYGYREHTDILQSDVTHEFYQWWEHGSSPTS